MQVFTAALCEFCEGTAKRKFGNKAHVLGAHQCSDCGEDIPVYKEMGGNGYHSQTVDHFHLVEMDGKQHFMPVNRELCLDCYRIDFKKRYPGEPLPV